MKWEATQKISPSELVRRMLTNTRDTGEPVSRHTLRIVPVEKVSYAAVEDVVKAAKPLIGVLTVSGISFFFFEYRAEIRAQGEACIRAMYRLKSGLKGKHVYEPCIG